jgi:hypothetical protein
MTQSNEIEKAKTLLLQAGYKIAMSADMLTDEDLELIKNSKMPPGYAHLNDEMESPAVVSENLKRALDFCEEEIRSREVLISDSGYPPDYKEEWLKPQIAEYRNIIASLQTPSVLAVADKMNLAADEINGAIDRQIEDQVDGYMKEMGIEPDAEFHFAFKHSQITALNKAICDYQSTRAEYEQFKKGE